MLQEYFTLVKITNIKQVDGAQQDTVYFWGVENPALYKRLQNTSWGGNLKKTVKGFDIGYTRVSASIVFKTDELLFPLKFSEYDTM